MVSFATAAGKSNSFPFSHKEASARNGLFFLFGWKLNVNAGGPKNRFQRADAFDLLSISIFKSSATSHDDLLQEWSLQVTKVLSYIHFRDKL